MENYRVAVRDVIEQFTEANFNACDGTPINSAEDYENWLEKNAMSLPVGASTDARALVYRAVSEEADPDGETDQKAQATYGSFGVVEIIDDIPYGHKRPPAIECITGIPESKRCPWSNEHLTGKPTASIETFGDEDLPNGKSPYIW